MTRTVLVTGASRGIGRATAELLAARGHRVFGTSRSPGEGPDGVDMLRLDVTDDASVAACVTTVLDRAGALDALVNNAGFGMVGPLADASVEDLRRQLDTNLLGVHRMVRAVLPHMRDLGAGTIVNVGSLGGRISVPFQALYSASKAALAAYSDGLRMELMREGIVVACVEPGDTATDFDDGREPVEGYGAEGEAVAERALDVMREAERRGPDPAVVARTIERIVRTGRARPRYVTGAAASLVAAAHRLVPGGIWERIVMANYRVPRDG